MARGAGCADGGLVIFSRLRALLGPAAVDRDADKKLIHTVRGLGYILKEE